MNSNCSRAEDATCSWCGARVKEARPLVDLSPELSADAGAIRADVGGTCICEDAACEACQ